jgi:hypothetical protein
MTARTPDGFLLDPLGFLLSRGYEFVTVEGNPVQPICYRTSSDKTPEDRKARIANISRATTAALAAQRADKPPDAYEPNIFVGPTETTDHDRTP